MNYFIGNTDLEWYWFLKQLNPEDINFWQPSGMNHFRAVESGSPFLLRLKSPVNKIGGMGFFVSHSLLPIDFAWEVFQERNGIDNFLDFYQKIKSYRDDTSNPITKNPNIGCIVLTNPIFFEEHDWITIPENWSLNIVQGKTYNTYDTIGKEYWKKVEQVLQKYTVFQTEGIGEPNFQYGQYLTNIRLGQGAFRVLVTDAYLRRCAISGERTLPVLEAAHIKPYSKFGINNTNNGLLLRADLHKLFDTGYITVTKDYNIEISKRIKEEFENGRDYYKYHGKKLVSLPQNTIDLPVKDFLVWHNENVFRA